VVEGCQSTDLQLREAFRRVCPVSCGTCFGMTTSPTPSPTECTDAVGYCDSLSAWCNSDDPAIAEQMKEDCAMTCGFCEDLDTQLRRRNKISAVDFSICIDLSPKCYTRSNFCDDRAVQTLCPKTCGVCGNLEGAVNE